MSAGVKCRILLEWCCIQSAKPKSCFVVYRAPYSPRSMLSFRWGFESKVSANLLHTSGRRCKLDGSSAHTSFSLSCCKSSKTVFHNSVDRCPHWLCSWMGAVISLKMCGRLNTGAFTAEEKYQLLILSFNSLEQSKAKLLAIH